jgi:hypothetical protein
MFKLENIFYLFILYKKMTLYNRKVKRLSAKRLSVKSKQSGGDNLELTELLRNELKEIAIGAIQGIRGNHPQDKLNRLLIINCSLNYFNDVKKNVEDGANINSYDDAPLRLAAGVGNFNMVKYLLDRGANVHANNDEALRRSTRDAIGGSLRAARIVDLLKQYGALSSSLPVSASERVPPSVPPFVQSAVREEDSNDFNDIQSNGDFLSDKDVRCTNTDLINLEEYDTDSDDVFSIFYLNNSNKFTSKTCLSKSEMQEYLKTGAISVITTIWKGGDVTGRGGRSTLKFIITLPPNNVYVTLGSFDKMMNSSIKNWYLLPLYGGKRRRIGYEFGMLATNRGQIPGSKIYKAFTEEEILAGVVCKESDSDYPLYLKDYTIDDMTNLRINVIESIKKHFLID